MLMTCDHDFVQLLSPPVARVRAVDALPPAALASLLAALPGDRNSDPDWVRVQSLPLRTAQPKSPTPTTIWTGRQAR